MQDSYYLRTGRGQENRGWQTDTSKEISVSANVMLDKLYNYTGHLQIQQIANTFANTTFF